MEFQVLYSTMFSEHLVAINVAVDPLPNDVWTLTQEV